MNHAVGARQSQPAPEAASPVLASAGSNTPAACSGIQSMPVIANRDTSVLAGG